MFEECKNRPKTTMGKKKKRVDEITALLAEEIIRAELRAFMQYQKASTELERLARNEAQITEREHPSRPGDQARREDE